MSDSKRKNGTFIHGVGASEHLDSSGERIKIDGVDISSLTRDGVLNLEHQSKEASSIVGKIWEATKILKRSDCENDHHKYFWDKVKMPFIYIAGELFDGVGHKEAQEVAAMVRYDSQEPINKDSKKLINFSIEGSRMEKQGAIITKCIARKISITLTPCNKICEAEELKLDPKEEKHSDSGKFSFIQDIMDKSDEPSCQIMKGENPFLYKAAPAIAAPKKPKTTIARPDAGFGAIKDKTPKLPAKPNYGKVIVKAKPVHPKDPVLNYATQGPKAMTDEQRQKYEARTKAFAEKTKIKKKLNKYDSNVRKALTASCGLGSSPAAKVQGDAIAKAESLPRPKFFDNHKGLIPKSHSDHPKAIEHISQEHLKGNKLEARRLHDRYISGGGNYTLGKSEFYLIAKSSWNVKEQRKKVFGKNPQPAEGAMRDKHLAHIKQFVDKFLGLDLQPSGGKINPETGERRDKNPEIGVDKPDWRSGNLESQWNVDAAIHEIAHVMLLPKGLGLEEGQKWMDENFKLFGTAKKGSDKVYPYPYAQGKRSRFEVQPMAAEQLIRRFLGLPANQNTAPTGTEKHPTQKNKYGKPKDIGTYHKDASPRMAVDNPNEVIGTRVSISDLPEGKNRKLSLESAQKKYNIGIEKIKGSTSKKYIAPSDKIEAIKAYTEHHTPKIEAKRARVIADKDDYVDLIRQARFLHPEHRQRLEHIFTGKLKFDPDRGWLPNKKSLDAAITNRQPGAVIARQQKMQAQAQPQPQAQQQQELPPNVVRMKQRPAAPAPMAAQPAQDPQNQVNPPEMGQPKMKIAKSEIQKIMKSLGNQAFERFEKKEDLIKFLAEKLPNLSEKERLAIAKAVAYTNEKKKELILTSLVGRDDK